MNTLAEQATEHRKGMLAAAGAFLFWGLVPFYFKALGQVGPLEIIAHRIVWSVPVLVLFLVYRDGRHWFRRLRLPPRQVAILLVSGLLVSSNWLIYVWAVVTDRVISTSLGYFINPLVNVLLGYLFLHERLSRLQVAAVALAAMGTLYLGVYLGQPPWISLALGFSFGMYGLVRKRLPVGPMTGLMWEVGLLAPLALAYLLWRHVGGALDFMHVGVAVDGLLLAAGVITVVPLVWFNYAAQKLPLTTVGFFQYTTPSLVFLLAVFVWHEPFTPGHAVAFGCIWTALAILTAETLLKRSKRRRTERVGSG